MAGLMAQDSGGAWQTGLRRRLHRESRYTVRLELRHYRAVLAFDTIAPSPLPLPLPLRRSGCR